MSEENKTEEVVEEEVVTEEETTEEESTVSEEVSDAMDAFDKKMDGEEDDSTEDDTSEEEETATEEDDAGEEEEKTAEDKAIEEAVKDIEKETSDAEEEKVVEKKDEVDKEKYVSDLDPEEWDDDAIKADTEKGQKHLDEINEMKAERDELKAAVQQQAATEYTNWFDRKVAGLGEDFHESLGVGDFEDIEPGSPEMENRGKIDNKMRILEKAFQKAGKPVPSRSELFKKAVSYEFNEIKNKSKTEKATVKKMEKRAAQTIGKGSSKASAISASKALKANTDFDEKIDS